MPKKKATETSPVAKKKTTIKKAAKVKEVAKSAVKPAVAQRKPTMRLVKFLAYSGCGSLRESLTLIDSGRVTVNGRVISRKGYKIDPNVDVVNLDGNAVKPEQRLYFVVYKPPGYSCLSKTDDLRPRVVDLLKGVTERMHVVGRLGVDSVGLVLATNDGRYTDALCHPVYRIPKTYHIGVKGILSEPDIKKMEAAVFLQEGSASPAKVLGVGRNDKRNETVVEMTCLEGRGRAINSVLRAEGYTVTRIMRIRLGNLSIDGFKPGEARQLSETELAFADAAVQQYQANRTEWDASLPPKRAATRIFRHEVGRSGDRYPRPTDVMSARHKDFKQNQLQWRAGASMETTLPTAAEIQRILEQVYSKYIDEEPIELNEREVYVMLNSWFKRPDQHSNPDCFMPGLIALSLAHNSVGDERKRFLDAALSWLERWKQLSEGESWAPVDNRLSEIKCMTTTI